MMTRLKPWYQVVTPREDLRENRPMDASEFAVHLDHIRLGRENVSKDYMEPDRFFERTYLTESLLGLSSQVVRRLSGVQVETSEDGAEDARYHHTSWEMRVVAGTRTGLRALKQC